MGDGSRIQEGSISTWLEESPTLVDDEYIVQIESVTGCGRFDGEERRELTIA